ncbi:MAG: flagellar motor switch phosphatase FliY [Anaerovoracaceae bacterium]|jgi:flagellar motor switch protein FliN/FliY
MSNLDNLQVLTEMETDVIGEVMNISMGAGATAMSTILDKKVSITTPRIKTQLVGEFEFTQMDNMIGVLIHYIQGVEGTNILLLKESDLKKILGHLLSYESSEIVELDEIGMSVICEIMNQMMGSSSSALASFLGKAINISPPEILDTTEKIKELFLQNGESEDSLVAIEFNLSIDGLIESEFISLMQLKLAKEIVAMSFGASDMSPKEEAMNDILSEEVPLEHLELKGLKEQTESIEQTDQTGHKDQKDFNDLHAIFESEPQTADVKTAAVTPSPPVTPSATQASKEQVYAVPYEFKPLESKKEAEIDMNENNLELIMSVPIQITVELGKTKKKIKDIADLTVGNIVELDRQAGDRVDVVANGKLIAKGDVVVVDDNYSVRITEIVKAKDLAYDSK